MSMTWREAAIVILKDYKKPLSPQKILNEIFERKLKSTRGITPKFTLTTELYRTCVGHEHVTNHSGKKIFYEDRGVFGLFEWLKNGIGDKTNSLTIPTLPTSVKPSGNISYHEMKFQDEDDEVVCIEGREKYLLHKKKERRHELIALVKNKMYLKNPDLPCFVCNFSFSKRYGKHGEKFIEAHHLIPISELTEETVTREEDIVLVCSNCHKMIHRFRPWLSIDKLKNILK